MELKTEDVLCAEAQALHGKGAAEIDTSPNLYLALNRLNSAALCLSGGGIRSAAFALGVIQALALPRSNASVEGTVPAAAAEKALLTKIHYLSTVSGGGYIGSWLSVWRMETAFAEIWGQLVSRPDGPDTEPRTIEWLRSFSNYLTPKIGLMSADTWAASALWICNLLLNWFVILPPICAVILFVKLVGVLSTWVILWGIIPSWDWHDGSIFYFKLALQIAAGIGAAISLGIALVLTTRGRPGCKLNPEEGPTQDQFLWGSLFWSMLSAFLLVNFLASDLVGLLLLNCKDKPIQLTNWLSICSKHVDPVDNWLSARHSVTVHMAVATLPAAVVYSSAWLIAGRWRQGWRDLLAWTVSGGIYGALVALALHLYLIIPDEGVYGLQVYFLHLAFGVPWILLSQTMADMIFVGLTSYEHDGDADREWFGRSAGWYLAATLAWLLLGFLVFFGTIVSQFIDPKTLTALQGYAPAIATISGLVTAFFGKSAGLPVKGEPKGILPYITGFILPIAAVVFIAALVIIISFLLDHALFGAALMPEKQINIDYPGRVAWLVASFFIALGILAISSWSVNINRFSLHAIYRNRLTRAFLGAARKRKPDPFTDFDPKDNPEMFRLWSPVEPTNWRPFHVINIALNIVSSEQRLAWQERKAAAFTVTPLHSGSSVVGYRSSREYGGDTGITLGTAMAISGAAASPNMGYHSSPAITFLMTMFNVRLGWWLGNPGPSGEKSYNKLGPTFAIRPLVQEAFGLTTADADYVYLSDGGHFENLGLYEMVRRRCRFIIVSDAGWDPDFAFEDLSNAVRKIAIDLGVQINFQGLEDLKPRPDDGTDLGPNHPYSAIGEIDYQSADGGGQNGKMIYIKAGYHGTESAGVRGYAKAHPEFPHQATSDQWFTEFSV